MKCIYAWVCASAKLKGVTEVYSCGVKGMYLVLQVPLYAYFSLIHTTETKCTDNFIRLFKRKLTLESEFQTGRIVKGWIIPLWGIGEAAAAKKRWKGGVGNSWLPPLWGNLCHSCQTLFPPWSPIEGFKNCQWNKTSLLKTSCLTFILDLPSCILDLKLLVLSNV